MRIRRFSSTHFRNLTHRPIEFSPGVNLFVGRNGHGKTNILEAMHFFKFGRSFRTAREGDLVRFGEPFCRIELDTERAAGDAETFAATIGRDGVKRITISGKEVARYSELVGRYPCVIFGPQDLGLVSGFPAERRRFLDMVGSMTDRGYLDGLRSYRRVLNQRNAALKARRTQEAQGVWTEELIERGCALVERRLAVVARIREYMAPHIESLGIPYAVEVSYESELAEDRPREVGCREQFAAKLAAVEAEELRRGTTLAGPQRDDLLLLAAGRDLRRFGSQGQRRLVAVLLRLAELSYLEGELGEPCVLLLDDLFSEFDRRVTSKLQHLLDGTHQVFVTSPVAVEWRRTEEWKSFEIVEGTVACRA